MDVKYLRESNLIDFSWGIQVQRRSKTSKVLVNPWIIVSALPSRPAHAQPQILVARDKYPGLSMIGQPPFDPDQKYTPSLNGKTAWE